MEDRLGDSIHCEEQLRTTLHSTDKEELRKRLALLQMEYLRTAQRLKRAEQMEAVRRHLRSRSNQQNNDDQTEADLRPSPSFELDESKGAVQRQPHSLGWTASTDNETETRTQMIRFCLPSDTACTPTSGSSQDSVRIQRASPALRLRSRRSRLRWEKKGLEQDYSTHNNQEAPEQTDQVALEQNLPATHSDHTPILNESEELFFPSEDESSSLLLSHWHSQGKTETGECMESEKKGTKEQTEKGISIVLNNQEAEKLALEAESIRPQNDKREATKIPENEKEHIEDEKEEKTESGVSAENNVDIKVENTEPEDDGKHHLHSCSLVEGPFIPSEYCIRTRRMAVSQGQTYMNGIIFSHLNRGRQQKSRGHGRPLRRTTDTEDSLEHKEESILEPTLKKDAGNNCPTSCDSPHGVSLSLDVCSPSLLRTTSRGQRGKRGRGRGRRTTCRLTPRHKDCFAHNSKEPHTANISSPSKLCLASEKASPVPRLGHTNNRESMSTVNEAQSSTASSNVQQVYPIFLKSSQSSTGCAENNAAGADWPSLRLPSLSPVQNTLLPFPSLISDPLLKNLLSSDVQDFHLPDDQFASLKLHKLCQVFSSGVEQFTSPSVNTWSDNRYTISPSPVSLSPCLTPNISTSPASQLIKNVLAPQNDSVDGVSQGLVKKFITDDNEGQNLDIGHQNVSSLKEFDSEIDVPELKGEEKATLVQEKGDIVGTSPEMLNSVAQTGSNEASTLLNVEDAQSTDHSALGREKEVSKSIKIPDSMTQTENKVLTNTLCSSENPAKNCSEVKMESAQLMEETNDKLESGHKSPSQLLLSPSLDSALGPFTSPQLTRLALPSVGYTPQLMTSPPTAPSLSLPHTHSPTSEALSPPALSPCPSIRSLPPSLPPTLPLDHFHDECKPPAPGEPIQSGHPESTQGAAVQRNEEAVESRSCTYTLKAPARGYLVDACCLQSSLGSLCVAAAGKWAVCLWTRTSTSDWSLTHTWTFNEPVISVFPVPDAPDLLCVTVGQLEIKEVRLLSCSSLEQSLLCDGVIQTIIGVPQSRVVSSSQTTATSILRVFTLSDNGSAPDCVPLVSPGVFIMSLASVDGLPDALIGTEESGCLFIWNIKTGHLLQKVTLGDALSHSACLRGYSFGGALFVLMQHNFLGSPEELEKERTLKPQTFLETDKEEKKTILFSLVAVNPRSRKSFLATQLYQPKSWCGRLCEADVLGSSLVALSHSGSVCVWELERPGEPRIVWAPESEGWQLARWGSDNILLTALHSGDIILQHYRHTQVVVHEEERNLT